MDNDKDLTMELIQALSLILDQVDYSRNNCRPNEMVAAVLTFQMLDIARRALARAKEEGY